MTTDTFKPGTAAFLAHLADMVAQRGDMETKTLPEDGEILECDINGSPFMWIAEDLTTMNRPPADDTVEDVINAMGLNTFVCPGSGQVIVGDLAKRGLAFGIGSERKGDTVTANTVASVLRNIIEVLPSSQAH